MQGRYSIFATLGTATQPFERFVRIVDEVALRLSVPVLIQTGFTRVRPLHCDAVDFLDREEFEARVREAEHVITHAGGGSVVAALQRGKRPIVIARRYHLGEHVNDHQMELASEFERMGLIATAADANAVLTHIASPPRDLPDLSSFHNGRLLELVGAFLES